MEFFRRRRPRNRTTSKRVIVARMARAEKSLVPVEETDRQSIVRILMRGVWKNVTDLFVGGRSAVVVGAADPSNWSSGTARNGDVEAVTWADFRDAQQIAAGLRHAPNVVDARVDRAE